MQEKFKYPHREAERLINQLDLWSIRLEQYEAYKIITLKNEQDNEFQIHILKKTDHERNSFLYLMIDEANNLLGIKNCSLSADQTNKTFYVISSNIEIIKRGNRLASIIELANQLNLNNFLQNNSEYEQIYQKIEDENQNRIIELERLIETEHDVQKIEELKEELLQKNNQRLAWENLYGDNGKLGFKKEGNKLVKTITRDPNFNSNFLENKNKTDYYQNLISNCIKNIKLNSNQ